MNDLVGKFPVYPEAFDAKEYIVPKKAILHHKRIFSGMKGLCLSELQ